MPLTRRQTLELGATAFAAALLRPVAALAGEPRVFEMALDVRGAQASAGWRTTPVLRAPRRFDLIGLRWRGQANLRAQMRARSRGGEWSRWVDLPSPHAPLSGTDPAWTGPCEFFQLRLRGSAPSLRARFVRVGRHRARIAQRRSQQPPGGAPPIITRSEWGGDEVPPRTAPSYGEVQVAFVHHTVTTNDYRPEDSAGIVLGIARYHRNSNGWNDIGYNFLVDKYGQIFEGRAGGMELAVIGAQAEGWNGLSTGIACLGTFQDVAQTEAGLNALARLIGWKLPLHGVPVQGQVTLESRGGSTNRYGSGTPVTFERISGHRDGNKTACPGELLYGQLADLRARAARYATPVSALTLAPAATRLRPGRAVDVSGTLRFADGSSPAGARVQVEFQGAGAAWQTLAMVGCASDGRWSARVTPPHSGLLRAVFPGDGTRPPLESATVRMTVVPLIRLSIAPRRLARGRRIRVSGTIEPVPADGRVEVRWERVVRGRWRLSGRRRLRVRGSAFTTRIKLPQAGRHRIWVVAPDGSRSGLVRVR